MCHYIEYLCRCDTCVYVYIYIYMCINDVCTYIYIYIYIVAYIIVHREGCVPAA